jgi:hypothetical protein
MKKISNKKLNFVVDYSLHFLHAHWENLSDYYFLEQDLGMTHNDFIKVMDQFQKKKIKIKQYPNE